MWIWVAFAVVIAAGALTVGLVVHKIHDVDHRLQSTCSSLQVARSTVRSVLKDVVADYPPAEKSAILAAIETGLPPLYC